MKNNDIYYANYDIDITCIKGAGNVTPRQPANRSKTTENITPTFKKTVKFIPSLYKITDRGDKIDTSGYVNKNNYIIEDDLIKNNYYTAQQFDNNINLFKEGEVSNKKLDELNEDNPIQMPPPLIDTKFKESEPKNKIIDKIKKAINNIKDKSSFKNNYIYTYEPNDKNYLDSSYPWSSYKYFFPKLQNNNYYPNNINVLNNDSIENFENINENDNGNYLNSNLFYLIIILILLIFILINRK